MNGLTERQERILQIIKQHQSLMGPGATLGAVWRLLWLREHSGQRLPPDQPEDFVRAVAADLDGLVDGRQLVRLPAREIAPYAVRYAMREE